MPCPTCSHTMTTLGYIEDAPAMWCPRCGTIDCHGAEAPKLVDRCRQLLAVVVSWQASGFEAMFRKLWTRLGIGESINLPENRDEGSKRI